MIRCLFTLVFFCFSFLLAYVTILQPYEGLAASHSQQADKDYQIYINIESPLKDIIEQRLQEAFKRTGNSVRVIRVGSSERALMMANEHGDGDAIRVAKIEVIAPHLTSNLIQVPEPIGKINFYAFAKDSLPVTKGWESLQGLRCGVRIGVKIAEKNLPVESTFLPETSRLFQMLNSGRLDIVVEHGLIGDTFLREAEFSSLRKLSPPLVSLPAYTYLHKSNQRLIPDLAEALQDMKKDGSFQSIQERILLNTEAE